MTPINLQSGGIITSSLDKRVRLWSPYLDLWGTLDQTPLGLEKTDKKWCFPNDATLMKKKEEIQQVRELLTEIHDREKSLDPNKMLVYEPDPSPEIVEPHQKKTKEKVYKPDF